MRIYLTDLASYNEGHLIGEWIDLPSMDIEGGFDQTDSKGFININAVRLKAYARNTQKNKR